MEQDTVTERIKILVEKYADKPADFAKATGLTNQNVYDLTSGRKGGPSFASVKKILIAFPEVSERWLLLGEGEMLKADSAPKKIFVTSDLPIPDVETPRSFGKNRPAHPAISKVPENVRFTPRLGVDAKAFTAIDVSKELEAVLNEDTAPFDAHAIGLLSDFPVVELPLVSFKARASFVELGGADVGAGNFERVLHRCGIDEHGNQRTPADYADAIVFEVDGDSMIPSMQSGQKVIAWPIPESKWEHLHNTACVVAYDDTVTVKAILENDLFVNNRLTLRATKPGGGYFVVGRSNIHSIWEVREFFGVVPYRLFQ